MIALSDEQVHKRPAMQSGKQEIPHVLQVQAEEQSQIEQVLQESARSCTIQHRCCKRRTETAGARCSLVSAFTTTLRGTNPFSPSWRACENRTASCTNSSLPGSRSSRRVRGTGHR